MISLLIIATSLLCSVSANGLEQLMAAEGPVNPNFCNDSSFLEEAGLIKSTLGQFLGYECSEEFYHCRWQSDGFRTYRKKCKPGLVYDVLGTQNCNYDYNVKSCGMRSGGPVQCNGTDFHCPLSEQCVPMSSRCDGHYDCSMEEDEQNCPLCTSGEFACKASEQCISLDRRCNGLIECDDGTDERDCDVCGHGLFHCGKSNECIPMDERCDGRRQCPHGEDEMLCKKPEKEKKFTCQSRDYEIPAHLVCDGQPQCPDGSDEMYCEIPTAPQGGSPLSFSSNLTPSGGSPSIPSNPAPQPPQPETEDVEEDYDYEQIKTDDTDGATFPMISLGPLPVRATTTTTIRPLPTRLITTKSTTSNAAKPAFSRPRPKINSVFDKQTVTESRSSPSTTKVTTKLPRVFPTTKSQSRVTQSRPQAIVQPPRSSVLPQPEEKVFIMQVTASPPMKQQESPRASSGTRTTKKIVPSQMTVGENGNNKLLAQITSQINGGMSADLLAKIEGIIKSEMQGGVQDSRIRRLQSNL